MPKKGQFSKSASKRSVAQRKYNSKPSSKKDRAARNRSRRSAISEGRVHKGDDKVLDHTKPLSKGGSRRGATTVKSKKSSQKQGGRLRSR